MPEQKLLRMAYLHKVCQALNTYLGEGHAIHVRSEGDGNTLEVTFTLHSPDVFHQLIEAKSTPSDPRRREDLPVPPAR